MTPISKFVAKHILWLLVIVIALVEIGYFLFRPMLNEMRQSDSADGTNTAITIEGENPYEISPRIKKIPQPSLDKKITAPTRYPAFYQAAMEEKLLDAKKILAESPYDVTQWGNIAILYENYDYFKDAEEIWEYLIKVDSIEPAYYARLASLYHFSLKDYTKAESLYEKTLALDSSRVDLYHSFHDLYKFLYKKDIRKAINVLKTGLENNPGELELLSLLANDYREAGDTKKSYEAYSEAITAARSKGFYDLATSLERDRDALSK